MANVQSTVHALVVSYLRPSHPRPAARELEAASASSAAEDVRRSRLLRWILKLGKENQRGENQVA